MLRILLSFYVLLLITYSFCAHGEPKAPCYFIFGDSLCDAGNNNELNTLAKANYAPYGVDFPGGLATGRFTNGFTIFDVITRLLGIQDLISPFSTAFGTEMLKGVNYASGSAGIQSISGSHLGDRIWLAKQVQNHGVTVGELQSFINGSVSSYLNKCLYTVNIGSDDYINNYFKPKYYPTKDDFNPEQFATSLINDYEQQLKVLYSYGARKTAIFGLGLLGCIPEELQINNATLCIKEVNQAVHIFNKKLVTLVDSLYATLPGAKFTFIDIAAMETVSPLSLGFVTDATCCKLRGDYQCEPSTPPCLDRNFHAYMDGFHPTEFLNVVTAKTAFNSPLSLFVHPVDINNLVTS
ncbi:hypothetical protein RND81_07G157900 [Saponaria officinalis]|uniref:Uncharacterized protein n=1 Tax=Saponaria officinalis TaxID=3572 RepID=A0AAW1JNU7_SAPOF